MAHIQFRIAAYPHPSVNVRMAKLRAWAISNDRLPDLSTAMSILKMHDLSASGYILALKREAKEARAKRAA